MNGADEFEDPEPFIRQGRLRSKQAYPRADTPTVTDPRQKAHRRLRQPAIALLLLAMANTVVVILFMSFVIFQDDNKLYWWPLFIGGFIILWNLLIIYGAFEMDRLGSHRMATMAAWLAIIPVPLPTYPLLLIAGIVALIRLSKEEVKTAFRRG